MSHLPPLCKISATESAVEFLRGLLHSSGHFYQVRVLSRPTVPPFMGFSLLMLCNVSFYTLLIRYMILVTTHCFSEFLPKSPWLIPGRFFHVCPCVPAPTGFASCFYRKLDLCSLPHTREAHSPVLQTGRGKKKSVATWTPEDSV